MEYYQERRSIRLKIEDIIVDYERLHVRNKLAFIMVRYVFERFVRKNIYKAFYSLAHDLDKFVAQRKLMNFHRSNLGPSGSQHSSSTFEINKAIVHRIHSSPFSINSEYPNQLCIISGIHQPGRI